MCVSSYASSCAERNRRYQIDPREPLREENTTVDGLKRFPHQVLLDAPRAILAVDDSAEAVVEGGEIPFHHWKIDTNKPAATTISE